MAFTQAQRVDIYVYLGWPPRSSIGSDDLDSAITQVQSVADGGVMPDSSFETKAISLITEMTDVDAKIKALRAQMMAHGVDRIKTDAPRAFMTHRSEGRMLVGRLARLLQVEPRGDAFA